MALTEYLCLDTGEVANNARVKAYARAAGVTSVRCLCVGLEAATGGPFVDPVTDEAPWYDAQVPASAEFCGVFLADLTGLATAPEGVSVTTLPSGYGSPGARLPAPRVMGATTTLIASTERGLNYGLQWLESMLTAESCTPACLGQTLQFFAHCAQAGMVRRYLYDVTLTDGPDLTARKALPRCDDKGAWLATVDFTFTANNPWIYLERQHTYTERFSSDAVSGCDVRWYEVDKGCPETVSCDTDPAADFLADPNCTAGPALPGYGTESDNCGCLSRFIAASGVMALRNEPDVAEPAAEWMGQVPVVEIDTGAGTMRRLTVRFFQRPSVDTDCNETVAALCDACAELNVPYLPGGATLMVDGRLRRALAIEESTGRISDATHLLRGPTGGRWDWPELTGPAFCVQILVDGVYFDKAAAVSVSLVPKVGVA